MKTRENRHRPETRRSQFAELLRDERGAAMTETVIMVPAFIIIWGCVLFIYNLANHMMMANEEIRQFITAETYGGCEGNGGTTTNVNTSNTTYNASTGATPPGRPGWLTLEGGRSPSGFENQSTFNERKSSTNRQVERPRQVGGGSQPYAVDMAWMCNEVPGNSPWRNAAREAWSQNGGS